MNGAIVNGMPNFVAERFPRIQQRIEGLQVQQRQANEAMELRQRQAHEAAQRQYEYVGRRRPVIGWRHIAAPAAGVAPPAVPPAVPTAQQPVQQPAQPVQQGVRGLGNAPAVPPPARPWVPCVNPVNPQPNNGRPEAMARPLPGMVRQRTNPFVDQRQFGVANQAPHRTGPLAPRVEHVNPGVSPDALFEEIALLLQGPPPLLPMPPLQPAHEGMPIFAPLPRPQAPGRHHDGNVNDMPPAPPAINRGDAGMIANWPEAPGFQPFLQWDQLDPFDWGVGGPPLPEARRDDNIAR